MGVIADKIRKAIFGREVRDSIADGIEVVEKLREDYDKQVINAGNSNAEIVDARGGEKKLKDRLDKENEKTNIKFEEVNASLAEKMNKNTRDISVSQINKNLGKFDETFMTDEFLQQISGNAPISTIIKDRSITTLKLNQGTVYPNNTNFIKTKNIDLLSNAQFTSNKSISPTTGEEQITEGYKITDFIPVTEEKNYYTNQSNNMAYYNEEKIFLKGQRGGTWGGKLTIPVGVKYIRLTYRINTIPYLYEVDDNNIYALETLEMASVEYEKLIKRISAKAIKEIPLKNELYNILFDTLNLIIYKSMRKDGYYTKDGWITNESYNSTCFIEVEPNTTYWSNETNIVVMYDENFLPLKQLWGPDKWNGKTFTTTEKTKYVTINYNSKTITPMLFKESETQSNSIYLNSDFIDLLLKTLVDKNKKIELKSIKPFNVVKDSTNIYNPDDDESLNTAIKPDTGEVYIVEGYQASGFIKINGNYVCISQSHNVAFYDESKSYISGISGGWSNPLTIPTNAKYLKATFKIDSPVRQINLGDTLLPYEDPNKVIINIDDTPLGNAFKNLFTQGERYSKLAGIKWNVLGNSITSTNYSRPNWWEILKDKYNLTVNNYGISGTTLAHTDERHLWDYDFGKLNAEEIGYIKEDSSTWSTGNCMCERFDKMIDDVDLITVMGSTNDGQVPLGEWNSIDTSTFYGALNVLITGLIKKYPNKKIAFFTPIQSANCYQTNVANPSAELDKKSSTSTLSIQLRAEAIKRKCNQYGIPCLDLFNTSGINGLRLNKYRQDDTLHPSIEGNKDLSIIIENFILTLF